MSALVGSDYFTEVRIDLTLSATSVMRLFFAELFLFAS